MRKIKKGDLVSVLAGKDKGKTGKVLKVVKGGERALVEGVNHHMHHIKQGRGPEAGIVKKEAPLHISNLALVSPTTNEAVRVGFTFEVDANGNKKKVRTVHSTGEILDQI
jgi:large subunit ribosomal protein L24